MYEDARFAHTIFLEVLVHSDDATVDFFGPGGGLLFTKHEDILFGNLTGNYELEFKIMDPFSLYAGAGAGVEAIAIGNNDFDGALDDDSNFVAQVLAGVRVRLGEVLQASAGGHRIFREDFQLLDDQFITNDTWGFDFSLGLRF